MKQIFTFLASVVLTATTYAQVGIGTTNPNTSAALDITSTTKGFLPPRMTTTERNAIETPATGLVIFNTTTNGLEVKSSTGWVRVNQNLAATASGITTSGFSSGADTLVVNFNNSFSSVTNYTVNFTNNNGTIVRTINNYALSGGVPGGQYTLVIQLVIASNPGTTFTFNGTGLGAQGPKTNFTSISTGSVNSGTRHVVLTFAYDGTNYFLSGSLFN
jgi:hypothetical protein